MVGRRPSVDGLDTGAQLVEAADLRETSLSRHFITAELDQHADQWNRHEVSA